MENFVMQSLLYGDREAQILGANQVEKFSNKQRHNVVEMGVIVPLVSMLQSRNFDLVHASLRALLQLAFGSERNKIRIVKAGVVPIMLNLMQSGDYEMIIELIAAAFLILSSCSENKVEVASSGAIPYLVRIITADFNNSGGFSFQTKLDALATIHNLTTCQNVMPLMVSSGVVLALLQVIHGHEKSSELVEKAVVLLENFVTYSKDSLLQTAATFGTIKALVETMEEGSPNCKEHAVAILLLLCESCRDKYRVLILREGVMPGLLQLSVDGTRRSREMAHRLLLLLRDHGSYGARKNGAKHALLEQIMQEIDTEREQVLGTRTLKLVEKIIAKLRK